MQGFKNNTIRTSQENNKTGDDKMREQERLFIKPEVDLDILKNEYDFKDAKWNCQKYLVYGGGSYGTVLRVNVRTRQIANFTKIEHAVMLYKLIQAGYVEIGLDRKSKKEQQEKEISDLKARVEYLEKELNRRKDNEDRDC